VHDRTRTAFPQVRDHRLSQPQRRAHVDLDHEPQVLGRRRERLTQTVRADGVHQHLRRAGLGGDPVDGAAGRGRDPGSRQLPRRRTAELTARAGHDRHRLAHAATPAETAPKTDVMTRLLPVMNGPGRSGRVQVHHREGERSSPDSGDPSARDPKAHPGLHITRARSPSLTLTAAMALTSSAPRSERQPRKPAPGTNRLSRGTHKAHRRTDDRVVGWDDRLHQHRW